MEYQYNAVRLETPVSIDADWNKKEWQKAETGSVSNYMGEVPGFRPVTEFRLMYDDSYIYVIFRVNDRYVLCSNENINDPVWEDSCVEFFFAADTNLPERYFNLEVNCGGIPLMGYNIVPREQFIRLDPADISSIEIAHSLPGKVDPEITEPVTWIIEYRIPLGMLEKYARITKPEKGVVWKANFYKIAVNNSNPHYMTWAPVDNPRPDFHLPVFFGKIRFK